MRSTIVLCPNVVVGKGLKRKENQADLTPGQKKLSPLIIQISSLSLNVIYTIGLSAFGYFYKIVLDL